MTSSRRHQDSDSDDTGRRRGHRTKRKITEEEMAEYMAKKIAKRMKAQTVSGYSNDSNPFGDSNLNERFVWKKKIEKEVRQGASLDQFSVKAEKRRHKERMAEMEKVKKSRKERDVRKAQREEELAVLARERARAEFQDWEKKEDEFLLEQSKLRSEIRLREGRTKLIDLLAKQQIDPVSVFNFGLSVKEMEELHNDIKTMQLGAAANPAPTFWEALVVVSEWELAEARKRDAFVGKEEERGLHSSIVADVECFLKGQTFDQLQALQSEIDSQMRSGTAKVVEFWEGVANRLHIYKAKACLKEIHAKVCLENTPNDSEKVSDQDVEDSFLVLSPMPALEEEPEGSYSPQLLHDDDDDVVNKEDVIHPEEDKAILERKRNAVLEEEQRRIQELSSNTMGPMADGDVVFGSNDEISLGSSQVYWWHDKYRPRKPKYFNRVHTGYEWNKYNQTHYDHDNPPPKTVHGYKFNIFYPDLVDKSKAPSYSIEKDGDSTETCIVRFHAGPPYEDVAFRIVNKEWEYSRKKGFKCTYERGILQLYFNFERYRYRR